MALWQIKCPTCGETKPPTNEASNHPLSTWCFTCKAAYPTKENTHLAEETTPTKPLPSDIVTWDEV